VGQAAGHIQFANWPSGRVAEQTHFKDRTLTGRIAIDGRTFERCRFELAVLVYCGGALPRIEHCTFAHSTFEFEDAAARSMALLQAMSAQSSGLRDIFKASFPRIFGH
jgi:hypothetical protein